MDHLQNELKKEFQIERMILFSDGVFAIAITLLVIELKVPEIPKQLVTESLLLQGLANLIPKFVGFLISFCIIGLFWTIHHRMFGYVVNYNGKLLFLNLFFLLGIALMPFSTGYYSEYILRYLNSPMIIYVSNICLISIANILLWRYISNPKNKLSVGIHPLFAKYVLVRAIVMPSIFMALALFYIFVEPRVAFLIIPFISLLIRLATRKIKRQLKNLDISGTYPDPIENNIIPSDHS